MTKKELIKNIERESAERLTTMFAEMNRTGEAYTLSELQALTGDDFLSMASISAYIANNNKDYIANGDTPVRVPDRKRIRYGEKIKTRTYVNIENPNDVLTVTRKQTTYRLD